MTSKDIKKTESTTTKAKQLDDTDLDQVQGGVQINNNHLTTGDELSVQINNNHQTTGDETSVLINNNHKPIIGGGLF